VVGIPPGDGATPEARSSIARASATASSRPALSRDSVEDTSGLTGSAGLVPRTAGPQACSRIPRTGEGRPTRAPRVRWISPGGSRSIELEPKRHAGSFAAAGNGERRGSPRHSSRGSPGTHPRGAGRLWEGCRATGRARSGLGTGEPKIPRRRQVRGYRTLALGALADSTRFLSPLRTGARDRPRPSSDTPTADR